MVTMNSKKTKRLIFYVILLLVVSAMYGCGSSADEEQMNDELVLDDDDGVPPNVGDDDSGGSDDDTSDDDDDTTDDDDDDTTNGWIQIERPIEGEQIIGAQVDVDFEYSDSVVSIQVFLDEVDFTPLITTSGGSGWGVIPDIQQGDHTLLVSGQVTGSSTTSDSVDFSTEFLGPYLELSLYSYDVEVGETVTADWVFYDEDLEDITGAVDVSLSADNGAEIQNADEILIKNAGDTTVTARCAYKGDFYSDSHVVHAGDFDPPYILINSPERGSFIQSSNIYISGRVEDSSPIDYLKYKLLKESETSWKDINVDSHGNFSEFYIPVPGMNTIQLRAADIHGNESHGNVTFLSGLYNPDGEELENTVGVRINQRGFDSITQVVEDLLNEMDFTALLPPNPIFEEDFLLVTVLGEIKHNTLQVGHIDLEITSPASGEFALLATVGAIRVEVRLYGEIFDKRSGKLIPYSWTIPVTASGADFTADLNLEILGGELYASINNVVVDIHNFHIGALPDWLNFINVWISETVETLVLEDLLISMIEEEAGPLIADALNELNDALNQEIDVLGYVYRFELEFESLETVDNGVTLWSTVEVEAIDPEGPPKEQPGSLMTSSTTPELDSYIPGTTTPYGFGVAIDDDLLNQALYEVYQSGLLSLRIDQYTAPGLGFTFNWRTNDTILKLLLPQLQQIHNDAPVAIELRPQIMPVIVIEPEAFKDSEVSAELQVGDYLIDMIVVHPQEGDIVAFTLGLALYLPVTIGVDTQANSISLTFAEDMAIEIHVIFEEVNFNNNAFEQFVPMVLDFLLPMLGGILESFPIPSFEGYTFDVESLMATGDLTDWVGLFGDLTAAETR